MRLARIVVHFKKAESKEKRDSVAQVFMESFK